MKKGIVSIVLSCIMLLLAGCNFQTVEQYEQMEKQQQSIETQQAQQQHSATPIINEAAETESTNEQSVIEPEENVAQQKEVEQKAEDTIKKDAPKDAVKEEKEAHKEEQPPAMAEKEEQAKITKQPAKEPSKKTEQQHPKKRVVTIAIQAKTLVNHWDLLDASLQSEDYVPKNGVILKATQYELLSEKDTVWDILQRATREHKIQLEYQGANENMYNSVYIEGINHLYEFSAGPLSGWMYSVNGVYPNIGCSQYILQDGDTIVWNYTVDLGRDLGQSVNGS